MRFLLPLIPVTTHATPAARLHRIQSYTYTQLRVFITQVEETTCNFSSLVTLTSFKLLKGSLQPKALQVIVLHDGWCNQGMLVKKLPKLCFVCRQQE